MLCGIPWSLKSSEHEQKLLRTWDLGGRQNTKRAGWDSVFSVKHDHKQRVRRIFISNELRIIAGFYDRSHFQVSLRVSFLRDTMKCAGYDQLQLQEPLITSISTHTVSVLDPKSVPSWSSQSTRRLMGEIMGCSQSTVYLLHTETLGKVPGDMDWHKTA